MKVSAWEAVNELQSFVDYCGDSYSEWYAGITSQPLIRIYKEHNVPSTSQHARAVETAFASQARSAETELLNMGFRGGEGGGDESSRWVYVYKITRETIP